LHQQKQPQTAIIAELEQQAKAGQPNLLMDSAVSKQKRTGHFVYR
jgi:hypothetical protein